MILAKPVVPKQFWILKKDDQKIGNIQANADGYQVTMFNQVINYKTMPALRRQVGIEFEPAERASKTPADQVHGYETGCRAYNGMWNVQMRVPLFTKQPKSKSWFAAGWYRVRQGRNWKITRNPKLIVLERYTYQGPYHSREQAETVR